jgi:hypothetical protein
VIEVPASLAKSAVDKTQGNPLFLEEITNYLGRVLINRGLRARLDPCPLSGALQTQIGHLLMSEECQLRTHVS